MLALRLGNSLPSIKKSGFLNLYSLEFDGVDDYVDLGTNEDMRPDVAEGVTYSCWCKWADITTPTSQMWSNSSIAGTYYGLSVKKDTSGHIAMDSGDGGGTGSSDRRTLKTDEPVVSNDTWHHIVCVFTDESNANWKIYVDGVEKDASTSGTGGANVYKDPADAPAFLGKRFTTAAKYFTGKLDECALWDTALNGAAILQIYNSGTPTNLTINTKNYQSKSSLKGYWRNGDAIGTATYPTINDLSKTSGHSNGTMTNMASGDIITDAP